MVHIHAEGPAFFSWLPKIFGKRVVVTIHGIDWKREKWKSGFGSKFIRQGEKNAVKYADEMIVLSKGVQGQILDELYSNTYIYTLPSDLEGMPLSLLEAMSYGNCCLVSDIPECAEVVEDKALIFKKSDVKSLREKMQDACDHPEKVAKMKKQSADFICEKYNWDDVVEKTIELYRGR